MNSYRIITLKYFSYLDKLNATEGPEVAIGEVAIGLICAETDAEEI